MAQVFISYSRRDLSFVERLTADLKNSGLDVWYDISGISGGSTWRNEIEKAITNSQFVIVVLSPDSIASEWVEREFLFASGLKRKIIPLMHRTCKLTLNYLTLNYLDVRGENYQTSFPRLLESLSINPNTVPLPVSKGLTFLKFRNGYTVSILIVVIVLLAGFSVWQLNGKWFSPAPTPTLIVTPAKPSFASTLSFTPEPPTSTVTLTPTPKPTRTKEPGFTIVSPEEVLNIAPNLRTFGQLAVEKYSVEERNKVNNTLTFTVNSTTSTAILWRWFWCAVNDRVLEQNMSKLSFLFDADGYAIPEEKLATVVFENPDPTYEGWKCQTYETVLRDWKPGTYKFTQTITYASPINDGRQKFEAGYKIYEYTVNIAPE
jgi:hypothetical protein